MAQRVIDVVGGLVEEKGRFLIAQRKHDDSFGGLWEFPGGAVEPGETKQEAIRRELQEELGIDVLAGKLLTVVEDELPHLKIIVHLFACSIRSGVPQAIECAAVRWVSPDELIAMELAPADRTIARWILATFKIFPRKNFE